MMEEDDIKEEEQRQPPKACGEREAQRRRLGFSTVCLLGCLLYGVVKINLRLPPSD
jgi:hypothetical protein